jgi:hypothetical protein
MTSAQKKEEAAAAAVAEKAAEAAKKQMEKDVLVRSTPAKKQVGLWGISKSQPCLPLNPLFPRHSTPYFLRVQGGGARSPRIPHKGQLGIYSRGV